MTSNNKTFFSNVSIVFMYYFTCISFAIWPSGRKSAIKLIYIDKTVTARFIKLSEYIGNGRADPGDQGPWPTPKLMIKFYT